MRLVINSVASFCSLISRFELSSYSVPFLSRKRVNDPTPYLPPSGLAHPQWKKRVIISTNHK